MAFRIAFDRQQVTYLGFLGLCLVLSVWTDSQVGQVRGLRGELVSGPWSMNCLSVA